MMSPVMKEKHYFPIVFPTVEETANSLRVLIKSADTGARNADLSYQLWV